MASEIVDFRPQACIDANCPNSFLGEGRLECALIQGGYEDEDVQRSAEMGNLVEECNDFMQILEEDLENSDE